MSRAPLPVRPRALGSRIVATACIALAALIGLYVLGIDGSAWIPREAGREVFIDIAKAALQPTLDYQTDVPAGTAPFAIKILLALWKTVLYAAAAMSLALPLGLVLGVLSSDVAWLRLGATESASRVHPLARLVQWTISALTALLRSVHELLWAVIFLAAMGLAPASAVVAIAIPFAGTIAKVTAGILDEAPRSAWVALDGLGAGRVQGIAVGLLPMAFADVTSYAFYRFECALRSAAVLGFFGAPTIGTYVYQSFENLQFREMWTYLYVMVAVVVLAEWLGARLRRSLR